MAAIHLSNPVTDLYGVGPSAEEKLAKLDIYTIYKGYELEFVIAADGDLQDADVQMLVDFISDMEFVPAA